MQTLKRPRFLSDLAWELNWLKNKAGAEVAERWYQELTATIEELKQHPISAENALTSSRKAFVPGASSDSRPG
jgi:plasmid stabilization system protein ParE